MEKIKELVENKLKEIETKGVLDDKTISTLETLIEIHRGIEDGEYLKKEREAGTMRYRNYDEDMYGARRRDSRGRYMGNRNDRYGHHMPEDYWERVMDGYEGYMDGMERYRRGNYNGKDQSIESLEKMLDGIVAFMEEILNDPERHEEKEVVKHYIRTFTEM